MIFLLFLAQPLLGLFQHHRYRVSLLKNPDALPSRWLCQCHIWFGRVLLILGVINGGLGLQLGANTVAGEKVYGAIAGIVFIVYVAVLGWWYLRQASRRPDEKD